MRDIIYCSLTTNELRKKYGKFDVAIAIDVIEHVDDYAGFINEMMVLF